MLQLGHCADSREALEMVREEARRLERAGSAGWVMGMGARVAAWKDRRWPSRRELDEAAAGRPAFLMSFDLHSMVASSATLAAVGISEGSPNPPGGIIERGADGRATGVLLESACMLVRAKAPEPVGEERVEQIRAACEDLARHGFTEVHDLLSPDWLGPVLARLSDEKKLPLAVGLYAPMDRARAQKAASAAWVRADVELRGAKVFTDGTLNSRTAWMLHDFAEAMPDHPRGTPLMSVEQIAVALKNAWSLDLELSAHAIGDGAVRACLDGFELTKKADPLAAARGAFRTASGGFSSKGPFRIEHCELIGEDDVPRFATLGVTASIQPCHLLADVEALRRFTPTRLHRVLPLRELIDSGLVPGRDLIFGSDTPVVRPDPMDSIQAAVHRRREGTPESESIAPRQAIAEGEAWACFRPS